MKVKVCGMREAENLEQLLALNPDFVGFIFYDKSPRFVGEELDKFDWSKFPKKVKKVGVFVNARTEYVIQMVRKYNLDLVQLHGKEMPDYCKVLRLRGVNIIKAFSIDANFSFSQLNNYKPYIDYFLFDTKGENYGGNGITFDWSVLTKYVSDKPYFLSGGIDLNNTESALDIEPKPFSLDVNSKFEISPAVKNIEMLAELMDKVKNQQLVEAER
jgi:phosphoribosylanthranilate isomerase